MKLGFDIHGVIDTFGVFQKMIDILVEHEDVEIHVLSGLEEKYLEDQIGHLIDLDKITHFFSVTDHLVATGATVEWKDGLPWADDESWNRAKTEYCDEVGIDVLFDDSPVYAKYFDKSKTVYCQIHNTQRKRYKTR